MPIGIVWIRHYLISVYFIYLITGFSIQVSLYIPGKQQAAGVVMQLPYIQNYGETEGWRGGGGDCYPV